TVTSVWPTARSWWTRDRARQLAHSPAEGVAMSLDTLAVDAYQLTTLLAHADAGRLTHRVSMGFFFRKLPARRNYVVFYGLRWILEQAAQQSLAPDELDAISSHPTLGPALAARPAVLDALRALRGFCGDIDALPEGTLAFAGPGLRSDGRPLVA